MLLTPILWGATFPVAKVALEELHPLSFMAWTRALGCVTILAALPLLGPRGTPPVPLPKIAAPGALLGGLLFAGYTLQTLGLDLTTATNAGFITGLYVVFTPLMGLLLFGQSTARAVWIAVVLSVVGLALLSTPTLTAFTPRAGDVLVLASALAWAGHVTALGRFAPRFPAELLSLAQVIAATLFHLAAAAFVGLEPSAALKAAPLLVVTGVLGTGVAYTLQIVAQQALTPARAAVILSGESLASALLAVTWLGERLALHQWVGGGLITVAMVTSELGARRATRAPPAPM
ncbi:MAG TPA: DMT family transporter [Actinomycetota bacterium]|nr:DMT family transporter [Actinomycetota bacterium]